MTKSKHVLITGSSSGFGFGLALIYARNGYITYASVRNLKSDGALKLQHIAKKEALSLSVLQIDVTDDTTIKHAVDSIKTPIDILINNAGFGIVGPVEDFAITEIQKQYDTNVFGIVRMIKAVAPRMREQKSGMIINVSSINGLIPFPLWGVYCSSKYAVESLTEAYRFELSHFGIKVVLIEPGSFLTKFSDNRTFARQTESGKSVYKNLTDTFFERFNKANEKIKTGILTRFFNPDTVVNTIYTVSLQKNPSLRHRIGFDAQIHYTARRILPPFLWEKIMHTVYKW